MTESLLIHKILGGLAALASACTWALGSILFRKLGNRVSPLGMNLGKNVIGILYIGIILLLTGIKAMSNREFLILGASGLLGIALGDTLFFKALIQLGPRLTVLLGALGPVFTVILAVVLLSETPSFLAWIGILLTTAGVSWILWRRSPKKEIRKDWTSGIKYLLLSILCTSIGIIFAKIGVTSVSALQALFIRFIGGTLGLTLYGLSNRQINIWIAPFKDIQLLKFILFTVFVVVFGGFWLFLLSLKYIDASIATILNSTEPLFILPLTAFLLKEKISLQEIIGAIVVVSGVVLIFMR
jgi:drug/metabolite transporter (DMT)-like permease